VRRELRTLGTCPTSGSSRYQTAKTFGKELPELIHATPSRRSFLGLVFPFCPTFRRSCCETEYFSSTLRDRTYAHTRPSGLDAGCAIDSPLKARGANPLPIRETRGSARSSTYRRRAHKGPLSWIYHTPAISYHASYTHRAETHYIFSQSRNCANELALNATQYQSIISAHRLARLTLANASLIAADNTHTHTQ
jgi:hypothetical protein